LKVGKGNVERFQIRNPNSDFDCSRWPPCVLRGWPGTEDSMPHAHILKPSVPSHSLRCSHRSCFEAPTRPLVYPSYPVDRGGPSGEGQGLGPQIHRCDHTSFGLDVQDTSRSALLKDCVSAPAVVGRWGSERRDGSASALMLRQETQPVNDLRPAARAAGGQIHSSRASSRSPRMVRTDLNDNEQKEHRYHKLP
jgi:hypothetical protein